MLTRPRRNVAFPLRLLHLTESNLVHKVRTMRREGDKALNHSHYTRVHRRSLYLSSQATGYRLQATKHAYFCPPMVLHRVSVCLLPYAALRAYVPFPIP